MKVGLRNVFAWFIAAICITAMNGCAIHYFDVKTGTQHVVGFAHMKMRVDPPREGVRAAIYGIETIGLTTGSSRNGRILTVGWQELSQVEVMDNAEVRIEWITSDPFSITVGSDFPHATTSSEKRRDQCIPASSY